MSAARDDATPRSATVRAVALLFVALAFAGFVALGLWQVQRLHWKHALIARVDSRIHAAAVPAPARPHWPAVTAESDEYRRVFVQGRFLHGRDTRVQALTELGAGFWILTPLRTDAGDIVLVNRGFMPVDGATSPPAADAVRIEGLLRITEPDGRVLRRNDPASERWYSRDVAAITRSRALVHRCRCPARRFRLAARRHDRGDVPRPPPAVRIDLVRTGRAVPVRGLALAHGGNGYVAAQCAECRSTT